MDEQIGIFMHKSFEVVQPQSLLSTQTVAFDYAQFRENLIFTHHPYMRVFYKESGCET